MRSSGIMPRVRILAPFIFLASLILISVWLDRPDPRADVVHLTELDGADEVLIEGPLP